MSDYLRPGRFPAPLDIGAVARDWAARGFDCHDFNDPPGQEWNGFTHATNELVTVVEGTLEMRMDGQVIRMAVGDELFIPRHMPHSVRNVHHGHTRWLFGYD